MSEKKEEYGSHYSVLKKECLEHLTGGREGCDSVYADLTFGAGGHTSALAMSDEKAFVFATDQDPDALKNGDELLTKLNIIDKVELLDTNFEHFPGIIKEKFPEKSDAGFDGILMDLGVSSHHFDSKERGFSYRFDSPLDMRMNNRDSSVPTAAYLVNNLSAFKLAEIFKEYGEERYAKKIAGKIEEVRMGGPIETTKQLEDIIFHCYPKKDRYGKTNPSTRVFQALRIAVNRELDVVERVIPELLSMLKVGGKLAIITFHSLEDRIVKHSYKSMTKGEIPCKIITKKPILPSEEELKENNRSRSAKLRIIERTESFGTKNKYSHLKGQ